MAVVISSAQNEVGDFRKLGLDILPHRRRMVQEQLDEKFKKAADPLRDLVVMAEVRAEARRPRRGLRAPLGSRRGFGFGS